ncbi:MAG: DUF1553 domain-containing protein [Lentisphaeria bacterium]|nr:DUF1553 domain-containing protein [Lentisphaeria bacterium]
MIKKLPLLLLSGILFIAGLSASPFEKAGNFDSSLPINKILLEHWQKQNITPPAMASDAVFLRRLTLTAAGRLPAAAEITAFLRDKDPQKRAKWIDKILNSPEYADMQAMRFADMLRIKSEFPINLWPNAVQLYHGALRADLLKDRKLNEIFFEMLTFSGSNFRVPYANFFRASADRTPAGLAKMVLLTTCGMRESAFSPEEIAGFAKLFSRIRYKSTYEWKEEIVFNAIEDELIRAILPDGTSVKLHSAITDPRLIYANWLFQDGKRYFERAVTNRVWHWVFGRGIYPVADDLPQFTGFWQGIFGGNDEKNQPFSAALQEFLNEEFRKSGYSLRELYRVILNSALFQASSLDQSEVRLANGAAYPLRRLESEVLIDALARVTGGYDRYTSVIPEPFTYLPSASRAVTIADGSISTGVLDNFGRPPRDSGQLSERNTASTDSQGLYLMNSATLYRRILNYTRSISRRFRSDSRKFERIYMDILSRMPAQKELDAFNAYCKKLDKKSRSRALSDTVWILLNSKEFIFHH